MSDRSTNQTNQWRKTWAYWTARLRLVTGGSRGIGRAVVERLARDGASVAFGYERNTAAAAELEAVIATSGGNAKGVQSNPAEVAGVRSLFSAASDYLGGLDIVVLNAAVSHYMAMVDETEEGYDHLMDINAKATFFGLQEAGRRLRDHGRIVTISSDATVGASQRLSVYSGSKGAVEQFSGIAAREFGLRHIRANVVSPGSTQTEMTKQVNTPEQLAGFIEASPLKGAGESEDIADVVGFLVGPEGRWMTGQNLFTNGGATIA